MTVRTVLAIPCYNCGRQLSRVLDGVDRSITDRVDEIWVIDNRSTDDTLAVAVGRTADIDKLRVFRNNENVNLGGSHKLAFRAAQRSGIERVVILHGDDQASTREVADMLDVSDRTGSGTVLGSRFMRGSILLGYDWKRVLGNRVLNAAYSALTLRRLSDLGSGLNVFRIADLDLDHVDSFGNSLSFNYELLLDLVRRRIPFTYHPITWSESDQVTNARNVRIFTQGLLILLRWRAGRPTSPDGEKATAGWTEMDRA